MTETEKQELKVKVAELCPSLFIHVPSRFGPGGVHWRTGQDDHGNPVSPGGWVNLLNDLNACAEFEKELTGEARDDYYHKYLRDICDEFPGTDIISATATQRCKAFVKTMEEKR